MRNVHILWNINTKAKTVREISCSDDVPLFKWNRFFMNEKYFSQFRLPRVDAMRERLPSNILSAKQKTFSGARMLLKMWIEPQRLRFIPTLPLFIPKHTQFKCHDFHQWILWVALKPATMTLIYFASFLQLLEHTNEIIFIHSHRFASSVLWRRQWERWKEGGKNVEW